MSYSRNSFGFVHSEVILFGFMLPRVVKIQLMDSFLY